MAGSAPSLPAAAHDELVRRLGLAGPAFLLPPRTGWVAAAAGLPLAPAEGVVHRVHGHASNGGADAQPAVAAGLPQGYEFTLGVPHLADGGPAPRVHHADLTRRHAEGGRSGLLGQDLHADADRAIFAPAPGLSSTA